MEATGAQKQRIDNLSETAHQTVERAAEAASQVAERWGDKADELMALQENWIESARGYVKEHPFAALGIALAAGYLLSTLTRGRD
ncbi:MAG: DUF883 domain-containing protein [Betaproteobacteria bacterium]